MILIKYPLLYVIAEVRVQLKQINPTLTPMLLCLSYTITIEQISEVTVNPGLYPYVALQLKLREGRGHA